MLLLEVPLNIAHSEGGVARQALHHVHQKVLLQNVRLCQISFGECLLTSLGRERSKLPSNGTLPTSYIFHILVINYWRRFNANLALGRADYVSFHDGLHLAGVDGAGAENGVRSLVVGVEAVLGHPVLGAIAAEEHLEVRLVGGTWRIDGPPLARSQRSESDLSVE